MAADRVRPSWRGLRRVLKWLHLWLGLTVGLIFATVGLTGTVLAFQPEWLRWQHPALATAEIASPAQEQAALARIAQDWGDRGLRAVDRPSHRLPVWQGYFPDQTRRYFDPATGALLLTRDPDTDMVLWLRDWHTHLLAGEIGEDILGVSGLVSLFLLLSGLYLWWPRWRALAQSLRWHAGPPARRWFTWHRSSGALTVPLLLLVTATGTAMVYSEAVRDALRWTFQDGPETTLPTALAVRSDRIDWAALLKAADGRLPGGELRRIAMPKPDDALVAIRTRAAGEWHPNGRSVIWLDPYQARVVQVHDATRQGIGTRISEAMYPLHGGFVGGWAWLLAVAFSGLLPTFLLATGFLFWQARRRRGGGGLRHGNQR